MNVTTTTTTLQGLLSIQKQQKKVMKQTKLTTASNMRTMLTLIATLELRLFIASTATTKCSKREQKIRMSFETIMMMTTTTTIMMISHLQWISFQLRRRRPRLSRAKKRTTTNQKCKKINIDAANATAAATKRPGRTSKITNFNTSTV